MSSQCLTLHLSDERLRVVDGALDGNQIVINSLTMQESIGSFFKDDSVLNLKNIAATIEKVITGLQTKVKNVNIVIPDTYSFSQILTMPKLKEKELLSAIKYQADQFIPMPIEETAIDLEILYEDPAQKQLMVLIVAAPLTLITKIENVIETAGLIPEIVENELSATSRVITLLNKPSDAPGGIIYVNFGFTSTSLYYFDHKSGNVIESHTFSLGYELFLKEIQVNLNFDPKRAHDTLRTFGVSKEGSLDVAPIINPVLRDLVKEIEKFIVAVKEKHKVQSITNLYLFNYANNIPYLNSHLTSCLSATTSFLDISSIVKKSPSVSNAKPDLSSFITAIGGCLG